METFGRYQLVRKLGRGGMAEVFLAQLAQGGVSKPLAIKRLLPSFTARRDIAQRLATEARLTVWLLHPNIVHVFDFGRVKDTYYIAMEFVDGCDLRAIIRPRGQATVQLPMEVALEIAYRILDALRYAHTCTDANGRPLGIIHRDVSPHNILISRDGHPKLADFGVARAAMISRLETQPGAVLGKFAYMAPEQARGQDYDARVDIFAAGATLYEMLTGAKPFTERATAQLARKDILPSPPSTLRPSIPPTLDALVMRALAPRREDRFPTAEEMAAAVAAQLAALGPPKPHQLPRLVADATANGSALPLLTTQPMNIDDFSFSEDSLLGAEEVTEVRRQRALEARRPAPETSAVVALPTAPAPVEEPAAKGPPRFHDLQTQVGPRRAGGAVAAPEAAAAVAPPPAPAAPAAPRPVEPPTDRRPAPATVELWRLAARRFWPLLAGAGAFLFTLGVVLGRLTAPSSLRHAVPAESAPRPARPPGPAASLADARPPPRTVVYRPPPDAGPRRPEARAATGRPARPRRSPPDPITPEPKQRRPISDQQWRETVRRLREAQDAYARGDFPRALLLAQGVVKAVPDSGGAWLIIAASSCSLRRAKEARAAAARIDEPRRRLLRTICERHGVGL